MLTFLKYHKFCNVKVCGNHASSKSFEIIFLTEFAHLVPHFGNSYNILNFFISIIFVMVIFEKSCVKGSQLIWQSIWHISSFSYFRKLAHPPQPSGNASLINQLSSTLRKIFHQLKAQMTFSILSNKVFLVKVCTFI